MAILNKFGQEVGADVEEWTTRVFPEKVVLKGNYCRLEPLDREEHGSDLFNAYTKAGQKLWTYLPVGPFNNLEEYLEFIRELNETRDTVPFAIINEETNRAVGTLCLIRIDEANGSLEVGYVVFSPELQKTIIATEAQFLLMKYVFDDLQYRRYEWKCDSLNGPSRRAAIRLGFKYEGTFRQAVVYKGRTRDTQWFSIIDKEWTYIRKTFEEWLDRTNFENGRQKRGLATIRENLLN
ncbi:CPA_1a_G0031610.mRNA.1.CDS.1 [Saccharomyces cerevisiae]|nr:AMP_1a_G0031320.mRNA.1.CDS.1 [Saccharomyces cerevisiae]CAI4563306.1 CPA_1a_G0031610.mRNA.1.CDS.1 [Saccharomyces cerevisiae]CAI6756459.1 AMP_1a_G0031320.mRNA.1.CDS.1 [Saccharomyces cerevisiae]CAI7374892.1 CPA_1a_G0031610.mRNA.1.CDS.1 [Saccharomyces cerevisiae]